MDKVNNTNNEEFMTDEEVEAALDNLISTLKSNVGKATYVEDPFRIQQADYAYKVLKYLVRGQKGVKTKYVKEAGCRIIRIVGKNISFNNPEWFYKVSELADNFEVYPKLDGTVQMGFMFYNIKSIN